MKEWLWTPWYNIVTCPLITEWERWLPSTMDMESWQQREPPYLPTTQIPITAFVNYSLSHTTIDCDTTLVHQAAPETTVDEMRTSCGGTFSFGSMLHTMTLDDLTTKWTKWSNVFIFRQVRTIAHQWFAERISLLAVVHRLLSIGSPWVRLRGDAMRPPSPSGRRKMRPPNRRLW